MIFYYAYLAFFNGVFFNLFYMFLNFEDIILIHL
jgi:hypothetical protein